MNQSVSELVRHEVLVGHARCHPIHNTIYRVFYGNPDKLQDINPWVKTRKNPTKEYPKIISLGDTEMET